MQLHGESLGLLASLPLLGLHWLLQLGNGLLIRQLLQQGRQVPLLLGGRRRTMLCMPRQRRLLAPRCGCDLQVWNGGE